MRSTVALSLGLLSLGGCSNEERPSASPSASSPAAAPAFDVEGFCEATMAVGRPCEGDDELMEGNKIGLCTTTLRTARDDHGVKLDAAGSKRCVSDAKSAKLPDIRTLQTLVERFESCRELLKAVPSLAAVKSRPAGTVEAGKVCGPDSCAPGLYCPAHTIKNAHCTPQKPAGEPCTTSPECLGRCNKSAGNKCVAYCGSG